jgi:trimeric autotransporter adhesin
MQLKSLFKMSALTTALVLAGCGGDINITEGDISNTTTTNTTNNNAPSTPVSDNQDESRPGIASAFLSAQVSNALGETIEVRSLSGRLTASNDGDTITLTNDTVWALEGPVFVGEDNAESVTLEIEPGTIIFGRSGADYLVVSRGSDIDANGTATNPIIMTSYNDVVGAEVSPGQWGGLVILGNAPSTKCPNDGSACALQVEGAQEGAVFGGTDSTDSSGTLRYTVVKYAGFEIAPDNELNGITFGGVGSGTVVEYIQVHANSDDGVEFFGGSVNAKYLVLTGNQDDSVDWDNGYKGKLQYVYVEHARDGSDANRGVEGDGDGGNANDDGGAFQFSAPMIANMTIVGNTFDTEDTDSEGLLLRDQTAAKIMNLLVTGPEQMGECLEFDNDDTVQGNLDDGDLTITYSALVCSEPLKGVDAPGKTTADLTTWFIGQTGNQIVDYSDADARNALGINNDGSLTAQSTLLTAGGNPSTMDGFFGENSFVGAVGATDWRQGWAFGFGGGQVAVAQSQSGCPAGTTTIVSVDGETNTCQVSGRITSDLTLTQGNMYALSGAVFVGGDNTDSATLTVEPGVIVYGSSGNDYLVISRGSKIDANGTASNPITFTSAQHAADPSTLANGEAGQWGGLVILGNGRSTKCPTDGTACALQVEGVQEGAVFGGTDDTDNSGVLRYVRVMHGGFEIAPDNELNGITFGGVGSGTTVEYIQVHKNADDGVEFFGGAVNAKYVVLTNIQDDSVDWDNGYDGKMQFVLVKHAADDSDANRGIEGDGDGGNAGFGAGFEFSNPTVANMTIIGNNFDTEDSDSEGILLRDQTSAQLYNFVITGPAGMGECLEFDSDATVQANLTNNALNIQTSVIACAENFKGVSAPGLDTAGVEAWWNDATRNNAIDTDQAAVLDGIFTATTAVTATDVNAIDTFFTTTDFIGAVKDANNNWTTGWTVGL